MPDDNPIDRTWGHRFRDAFRGMWEGVRGQSSFFVHFFVAAAVLAAGFALRVTRYEWCILLLCIASVIAAELFNSAIESLAKAVTREHDPHVGTALNIAAGAVLVAAIGASVVGLMIFIPRFLVMLRGV
jgi:diacylglycerol kinase